jgi:hypothetical protein
MDFRENSWRADLLSVLEAFGHRLRVASRHWKVPVGDLGDDPAVPDPNVVTVTVYSELAFRLKIYLFNFS